MEVSFTKQCIKINLNVIHFNLIYVFLVQMLLILISHSIMFHY